jgi:DNA ligase-1
MLAKKYPEGVKTTKDYYIQEKLNGNRCIAWYDFSQDKWRYTSRSQKEKFYPFDMSKLSKDHVYDGEVMSRNAMGNRDFAKTSGLANSKYGDKSQLVYLIYDILDDSLPYKERWKILSEYVWLYYTENRVIFKETAVSENVAILPLLGKVTVYPNVSYNHELDKILDEIVEAGGEGIMLRDPDAPYHHSAGSGNRKNYLLKYKKLQTCDLRIIGWNEGKGKYEGYIGSFICETDDHKILVNVAGIDDDTRMSDPNLWLGKIIEVAYFDVSKSSSKNTSSLQFPRYVKTRPDKDETSMF